MWNSLANILSVVGQLKEQGWPFSIAINDGIINNDPHLRAGSGEKVLVKEVAFNGPGGSVTFSVSKDTADENAFISAEAMFSLTENVLQLPRESVAEYLPKLYQEMKRIDHIREIKAREAFENTFGGESAEESSEELESEADEESNELESSLEAEDESTEIELDSEESVEFLPFSLELAPGDNDQSSTSPNPTPAQQGEEEQERELQQAEEQEALAEQQRQREEEQQEEQQEEQRRIEDELKREQNGD